VRGGTKVMLKVFFLEHVIAITVKFTWMIQISFAIMRLFFHRVIVIFNTLLPTLTKTLYTSVVKFPALTSEHIMKTLFYALSSAKWHPHSAFFIGPNR
jgi:hypothetical protein